MEVGGALRLRLEAPFNGQQAEDRRQRTEDGFTEIRREREDHFGFRIANCGFEKAWGKGHGTWGMEHREVISDFGLRISDCGFEKAWGMEHGGKARRGVLSVVSGPLQAKHRAWGMGHGEKERKAGKPLTQFEEVAIRARLGTLPCW